jgi:hypothetical protein
MRHALVSYAVCACGILGASPALAQRLPFERTLEVSGPVSLDVSTIRGKIEVLAGDAGRVVVSGTVTVRVGLLLPADALEIAKRIAAAPPIEQDGAVVRLRAPSDAAAQRAVIVAYQVRVPPAASVSTASDSGATVVSGISGPVTVRTHSAAIDLSSLGGAAHVTTGSGAVRIDGVDGALTVETSSSRITARRIGSSLRLRTQSGAVEAGFVGTGDVDVETGSSAIRLIRVRGGVTASSQSGRITIDGSPSRDWALKTGSSNVEVTLHPGAGARLEASSGSTNVGVQHAFFEGTTGKGRVNGTIGRGGPAVRITSRSGQIQVQGS